MKTILFLDDELSILRTYQRILKPYGIESFFARNSKEAELIIEKHKVDLIISDYRLEQETGIDFLNRVRQKDREIPMIIISGFADEDFIKMAMESKVIQGFYLKPINVNEFRSVIERYIPKESL